jgi:hypothetical protein
MILFIDHDAYIVAEKQRGTAPDRVLRVQARELLADQMPLVEQ